MKRMALGIFFFVTCVYAGGEPKPIKSYLRVIVTPAKVRNLCVFLYGIQGVRASLRTKARNRGYSDEEAQKFVDAMLTIDMESSCGLMCGLVASDRRYIDAAREVVERECGVQVLYEEKTATYERTVLTNVDSFFRAASEMAVCEQRGDPAADRSSPVSVVSVASAQPYALRRSKKSYNLLQDTEKQVQSHGKRQLPSLTIVIPQIMTEDLPSL